MWCASWKLEFKLSGKCTENSIGTTCNFVNYLFSRYLEEEWSPISRICVEFFYTKSISIFVAFPSFLFGSLNQSIKINSIYIFRNTDRSVIWLMQILVKELIDIQWILQCFNGNDHYRSSFLPGFLVYFINVCQKSNGIIRYNLSLWILIVCAI